MHRKENAAMDRLQSVPDIWQGTTDDYAHRVIKVRTFHLIIYINRSNRFRHSKTFLSVLQAMPGKNLRVIFFLSFPA
jgi:hypothetical protein